MSDQESKPQKKSPENAVIKTMARKALRGDKEQLPLNDNTKEWPLISFPEGWNSAS